MSTYGDAFATYAYVDILSVSAYADIVRVRSVRDLGAAIKGARQRRGLTQAELAARAGVSRQWVISVERGKSTAEVGAVLRTFAALGLVADLVDAPPMRSAIDLDSLVGGDG